MKGITQYLNEAKRHSTERIEAEFSIPDGQTTHYYINPLSKNDPKGNKYMHELTGHDDAWNDDDVVVMKNVTIGSISDIMDMDGFENGMTLTSWYSPEDEEYSDKNHEWAGDMVILPVENGKYDVAIYNGNYKDAKAFLTELKNIFKPSDIIK